MDHPLTFFLIAGEPSGDRLGAALIKGLKQRVPNLRLVGVGGAAMQAEGFNSLFPMEDLSVMGISEVLPKLPGLLRRIKQTANSVLEAAPDALITIDSPDFCLRVATKVRQTNARQRIIHYVAPSVWAWRPERAAKMAPLIDQVLCLLPFEPPYMEAEGMRADFVGHPAVTDPIASPSEVEAFRATMGLKAPQKLVLALPGSRRSEVDRLCPVFGAALGQAFRSQDARIVLPTVGSLAFRVRELTQDWPIRPIILSPEDPDFLIQKRSAFAAADVALAASGTVSLELAAAGTPMVIAYDMNWLTRRIIASKLQIDTVTLVNLVSETRSVPELLGQNCTPQKIASALRELVLHPTTQEAAIKLTMQRLGRGQQPPGLRAADAVLSGLSTF